MAMAGERADLQRLLGSTVLTGGSAELRGIVERVEVETGAHVLRPLMGSRDVAVW